MKYLKDSLSPIANLSSESEMLPPVFGDNLPKVLDYAKKAEGMKQLIGKKAEKEKLSIVDVISLKDDIRTFLAMAKTSSPCSTQNSSTKKTQSTACCPQKSTFGNQTAPCANA